MKVEKPKDHSPIPLWEGESLPCQKKSSDLPAELRAFLCDGSDKAVVIFPGGGYFQLSVESEGVRVAKAFNRLGYNAFVVSYRYDCGGEAILADAAKGVCWVRRHADSLGISPNKIAVLGFSAGGHVSMLLCQQSVPSYDKESKGVSSRPDACLLAYPVVTLGEGTYHTMPRAFLGERATDTELIARYSYTYDVGAMPPTFVFTSANDRTVDYVRNSAAIAAALLEAGVDSEYKEYADGAHGMGLGEQYPEFSKWLTDAASFLNERFDK